jgi:hypothetical protein
LTIDDDLSWWLSWNWEEWLHDLWIWICHAFSLLGVKALVDIWVSEVILANDANFMWELSFCSVSLAFGGLAISSHNPSCSWDLLLDIGFDQICLAWTDGRYELEILGILGREDLGVDTSLFWNVVLHVVRSK